MNPLDKILIRAWCSMCDWDHLAELAGEEVDAKRRVKAIKQRLSAKARYYRRSEDVGFWLKNRTYGRKYCTDADKSLAALLRLPDPAPSMSDPLSSWFGETTVTAIPKGIATLGDLAGYLSDCTAGVAVVPPAFKKHQKAVIKFFKHHVATLGELVLKAPPQLIQPTPLCKVAPLEQIIIPEQLDGHDGINRAGPGCRLTASNDQGALACWLAVKGSSHKTRLAYKKEVERLLLWSLLERRKALSSLTTDDAQAYQQWLKALTYHNTEWVSTKPATPSNWKPFYYRMSRKDPDSGLVLTTSSINYALTVIKSCMSWLVSQQYLKHNNFDAVAALRGQGSKPGARLFDAAQMQYILAYAKRRFESAPSKTTRRDLFILGFGFLTGLRLNELANARFGDIERNQTENGYSCLLRVVGKGSKERFTTLPDSLVKELSAYLKYQGYPYGMSKIPVDMPIIPNLKSAGGLNPLSSNALYHALCAFFKDMVVDLSASGVEDSRFIDKLERASTHWLRHSYGSYLVNDRKLQLPYARDELGHSNISTTSIYLNSDKLERQRIVGESLDAGLGGLFFTQS